MKNLLVLDCRNFGDSVIGLGLIEALSKSIPELRIDVLTRPQFAVMRRNHPSIRRVECASFPMGTVKNFGVSAALHLAATIARLKMESYDAVVNIVGDFRENFIGFLIDSRRNWGPVWEKGHPILNGIRGVGNGLPAHPVVIGSEKLSVYGAVSEIARSLGATAQAVPRLYNEKKEPINKRQIPGLVGMHMSATQKCRLWPIENWLELGRLLIADGNTLRLYCSPSERGAFSQAYEPLLRTKRAELIAGPLEPFFESLAECSLLVAHDSFAMHVAYALDVPRIVINGPNIMPVWAPPGTVVLQRGESLPCYPCFNRPSCEAGPEPYACIRKVDAEMVRETIKHLSIQQVRKGEVTNALTANISSLS